MIEFKVDNGILQFHPRKGVHVMLEDSLVDPDKCWFSTVREAEEFAAEEGRKAKVRQAERDSKPEVITQSKPQWSFR